MEKEIEIIQKAKELFMQYGLRSITMDDLAKELGISKKTLYEFFVDKADLIRKILASEIDRAFECVHNLMKEETNVIDKMIFINKHLIEVNKKTPANVKFDLSKYYPEIAEEHKKIMEKKVFHAIKQNIENGKKQGMIRKEVDSNIIAAMQVGRTNAIDELKNMLIDYEYEVIINEIFDYHIRAISTEKGLNYYINKIKK